MPVGTDYEEVGFGFNRGVITGLLREQLGFDGIVCTDWGLLTDTPIAGERLAGPGVGRRAPERRGARCSKVARRGRRPVRRRGVPGASLVELVARGAGRRGAASTCRSRRLLREKFRLGLFDDPYVDADLAAEIVGASRLPARRRRGAAAVRSSSSRTTATLPLARPAEALRRGHRSRAAWP